MFLTIFYVISLLTINVFTKGKLDETYKLATTDGLTGLYNHRYFQEKISLKMQNVKRKEDSFSLLLIDIDFFKKFNDAYGHRAGDTVLIQVGRVLNEHVREYDIVCRYGGEEMCVILDKTRTDEAVEIAQKLVKAVAENPFRIIVDEGQKTVNVTISIGVANYPDHADTVPSLIEFADQGLYRAKESGRNRVGTFVDIIDFSAGPVVSKELEIEKAKIAHSIEKIIPICMEKGINIQQLLAEIAEQKLDKDKQDT